MYGPLPFGVGQNSFGDFFRTHLFINAGNITDASFNSKKISNKYAINDVDLNASIFYAAEDFAQSFNALLTNFRAAYGLGLAVRLGQMARVEINYCWPLKFSRGDKIVRGLQIGVGIDFL